MDNYIIQRTVVVEEEVSCDKFISFQIKKYRKNKKMTQKQMADKIGIARVSFVNIESGRTAVSLKNLHLICKALNIKSSQILPF